MQYNNNQYEVMNMKKETTDLKKHEADRNFTDPAAAGDAFIDAMLENRWDEVLKLVESGLKPRDIRHCDGANRLSALGLALEAGEYEVAEKLYQAGDRLDDYCHLAGDDMKPTILSVLTIFRRGGDDLFRDEHATLADCCSRGLLVQAEPLLESASRAELDRAADVLMDGLIKAVQSFGYPHTLDFMRRVFERGGRLSAGARDEMLASVASLERSPRTPWWHLDPENAAILRSFAAKYTRDGGAAEGR